MITTTFMEELEIRDVEMTAIEVNQIITHPDAPNQHAIIQSGDYALDDTQTFDVMHVRTDGGCNIYCASKTYKTYKGALKKAAQYLS